MLETMPRKPKYPQRELADRLRMAMDDAGVNLADLARACGVTIQAVHDWRETGRIGKQHLATICAVTKKPLEYFLLGLSRAAVIVFAALALLHHPAEASQDNFSLRHPSLCIMLSQARSLARWLFSVFFQGFLTVKVHTRLHV